MAIVAGKQALAAGAPPYDSTRIGVVLGTGLGTLDETISFMRGYLDGGPEAASPLLFPSSVMNAAAGQLALECKLRGVNSTVNHRDASALSALTMACDLLELGRADALLVGAVEELSAPALAGYAKLGAGELVLGEGAGMLLVEREADAAKRGARMRAFVAGRGERGDDRPRGAAGATPIAGPKLPGRCARPPPGRGIDAVLSGANGTAYDAREAAAVREGLGAAPPATSIVAQIGESFSSAAQRLIAAVHALEAGGAGARARARVRPGRRQRRRRPGARLMSRSRRAPRATTAAALPRIVERKPRRGDAHPLSPDRDPRVPARAAEPTARRPAPRRAARARRRRGQPVRHLPPRRARHHPLLAAAGRMVDVVPGRAIARASCAAPAPPWCAIATASPSTSPTAAWTDFMRDVLAHELGHHLRNQTVARYPRVARTADEEAVADLHARRTRARRRGQFTVTSSEPSRPQKLASRSYLAAHTGQILPSPWKCTAPAARCRAASRPCPPRRRAPRPRRATPATAAAAPAPRRRPRRSACPRRTPGGSAGHLPPGAARSAGPPVVVATSLHASAEQKLVPAG